MKKATVRKAFWAILSVVLLLFILDFAFPFKPQISYATQVTDRNGKVIHAFLSDDEKWRLYTALPEITPLLSKTLIYKEDQYF